MMLIKILILVDSKRFLMFLALFPFSEVVYIVAAFLAWVYITMGIVGNSHVAHENSSFVSGGLQQKQIYFENINECAGRNFDWHNHIKTNSAAVEQKSLFNYGEYFLERKFVFPELAQIFYSSAIINNKPKRAPPIFNS